MLHDPTLIDPLYIQQDFEDLIQEELSIWHSLLDGLAELIIKFDSFLGMVFSYFGT